MREKKQMLSQIDEQTDRKANKERKERKKRMNGGGGLSLDRISFLLYI